MKQAQSKTKTIKWVPVEYAHVNGIAVVYDRPKGKSKPDDLVVHLPGGLGATIKTLRSLGYSVTPPIEVRQIEFA